MIYLAFDLVPVILLKLAYGRDQYGVFTIAFGMAIILLLQLIAGLAMASNENTRVKGQALLMATLLLLLVGFGICTI